MCTHIYIHIQTHSAPSVLTTSKLFNTTFHSDKTLSTEGSSPSPHRSQKEPIAYRKWPQVTGRSLGCVVSVENDAPAAAQVLQVSVTTLEVTSHVSVGVPIAVLRRDDQKQIGKDGVYVSWHVPITDHHEEKEKDLKQEPGGEAEAGAMEGSCFLAHSSWLARPAVFWKPGPQQRSSNVRSDPGPPTATTRQWNPPQAYPQANLAGGISSVEVPSSQVTPVCVIRHETSQHRLWVTVWCCGWGIGWGIHQQKLKELTELLPDTCGSSPQAPHLAPASVSHMFSDHRTQMSGIGGKGHFFFFKWP